MKYEVVGKFLVDVVTGEIVEPTYTVSPVTKPTNEEKQFYRATSRAPEECTDPEQLKDFVKATQDMRGIKLQTNLVWFKKESDYGVVTLKQPPLITNPQYETLTKLVNAITYKNIILCKRSELAKTLGCLENHLTRKLRMVEDWIKIGEAKKGFIKIFVTPSLAWKGRDSNKDSAYKLFYAINREWQEQMLMQPSKITNEGGEALVDSLCKDNPEFEYFLDTINPAKNESYPWYSGLSEEEQKIEKDFLAAWRAKKNK